MKNKLLIEKATINDLPFLIQLENLCFPDYQRSTTISLKRSIISDHQMVFIGKIQNGNKLESNSSLILHRYKRTLRLFSIAVLPEYRKLQIGNLLINFYFNIAKKHNYERLSLEVLESNTELIKWYEKLGFSSVKSIKDYYDKDQNGVRMILKL